MNASAENLLMVANSDHNADMLYAVGLFVPDPFIYFRARGKSYVVLSDLELDRARREIRHCRVLSHSSFARKMRRRGFGPGGMAGLVAFVLREHRIEKVKVPEAFPLGLALRLQEAGLNIDVARGSFFSERVVKSAEEVKKISAALIMAEVGLAEGIHLLKHSRIGKGGRLMYKSTPLTAEKLRAVMDTAIVQAGGVAHHTIVACGKQGCDPHEAGFGPLRAHQPIILDVFPRSQKTGYFADITRTVVKGRASDTVRKAYAAVANAQALAIDLIKNGRRTSEVHQAVERFFGQEGFKTGKKKGRVQGFFHGTGHGLGLEIHEAPMLSGNSNDQFSEGQVMTVEPGLYYPEWGGVRLEDIVWLSGRGPRNLTRFEKVLEI